MKFDIQLSLPYIYIYIYIYIGRCVKIFISENRLGLPTNRFGLSFLSHFFHIVLIIASIRRRTHPRIRNVGEPIHPRIRNVYDSSIIMNIMWVLLET